MAPKGSAFGVIGTIVDSLPDWSLRIRQNSIVCIDDQGTIVFIDTATPENIDFIKQKYSIDDDGIIRLENRNEFLLPGFIDSHIHASQFPNSGLGQDMGLLDWLQAYTFPMERSLAFDEKKATEAYKRVVETTLASGTTAAAYYATIGRKTSEILCDMAEELGQRALVGKVCMTRNAYDGYQETIKDSLQETELFVASTLARNSDLVAPVITPRFVPNCETELLVGLADIVKKHPGIRVQTHLSECLPEMAWVKELEPWAKNYTEIYAKAGLLTDKTILAHGVYLDDSELRDIREFGSGISHCPNSNNSLGAGAFDVVRAKKFGVKIGLGTDCAGGYSASIMDSMRFAISTANFLNIQNTTRAYQNGEILKFIPSLDFRGALFLATRGSAAVAGLEKICGHFEPGLKFDALRIRMNPARNSVTNRSTELFGHEGLDDIVQKFVLVGDDRNLVQIFVNGRLVKNLLE